MAIGELQKFQKTEAPRNLAPPSNQHLYTIRSSRLAALCKADWIHVLIPKRVNITELGIQTKVTKSAWFPWIKEVENMAFKRVASVRHIQGMVWDEIVIESIGGSNTLDMDGLTKKDAHLIVDFIQQQV